MRVNVKNEFSWLDSSEAAPFLTVSLKYKWDKKSSECFLIFVYVNLFSTLTGICADFTATNARTEETRVWAHFPHRRQVFFWKEVCLLQSRSAALRRDLCLKRLKIFSDEPGRRGEGQNWIETQSRKTLLSDENNQFSLLIAFILPFSYINKNPNR